MSSRHLLAGISAIAGLAASAATLTILDGKSDWTVASSYQQNAVPQAGDTVQIPADATVRLSDSDTASLALFRTLARVVPLSSASRLEITVNGMEEVDLPVPISAYNVLGYAAAVVAGPVVKKGPGKLHLSSGSLHSSGWQVLDYLGHVIVEEGELALSRAHEGSTSVLGWLEVAAGATLHLPQTVQAATQEFLSTVYVQCGIEGAGTVCGFFDEASASATGKIRTRISHYPWAPEGMVCNFSGVLTNIYTIAFSDGCSAQGYVGSAPNYVLGLDLSDMTDATRSRVIGFAHLGANKNDLAVFGTKDPFQFTQSRYVLEYRGTTGETIGKSIYMNSPTPDRTVYPMLSGGDHGGLNYDGTFFRLWKSPCNVLFGLGGDGPVENVFAGHIDDNCESAGGDEFQNKSITFVKEGKGSWRFTQHVNNTAGRKINDVFRIKEGTLSFDVVDEKGCQCAMGTQTNCTDGTICTDNTSHYVDYAIAFGEPKLDGTKGTRAFLGYSGTTAHGQITTRKAVLRGAGGLKNDTDRAFQYAGVRADTTDDTEFVLAGSGTGNNRFAGLREGVGHGRVSLVKEGTGTWTVCGEQSISGDLVVTGGTLVVERPASPAYTWFRFTAKEVYRNADYAPTRLATYHFMLEEFGLFDSNGQRINLGLTGIGDNSGDESPSSFWVNGSDGAFVDVQPGQACLQTRGSNNHRYGSRIRKLFDGYKTVDAGFFVETREDPWATSNQPILPEDPVSWVRIVMRLTNGVAEATSYDYMNIWRNYGTSPNDTGAYRNAGLLKAYSLEGSIDGLEWNLITNDVDCISRTADAVWAYDGSNGGVNGKGQMADDAVHHGFPMKARLDALPDMLDNVRSVKVAGGATLRIAGGGAYTISNLKLDAVSGGTIDGATFASQGALDIAGMSADGEGTVPVAFIGANGLGNLSRWTLSLGGTPTLNRRVTVSDGQIAVVRAGMMVIVR